MLDYRFVGSAKLLLVCLRHGGQASDVKKGWYAVHGGANVRSAFVALGVVVVVAAYFGSVPSCCCAAVLLDQPCSPVTHGVVDADSPGDFARVRVVAVHLLFHTRTCAFCPVQIFRPWNRPSSQSKVDICRINAALDTFVSWLLREFVHTFAACTVCLRDACAA